MIGSEAVRLEENLTHRGHVGGGSTLVPAVEVPGSGVVVVVAVVAAGGAADVGAPATGAVDAGTVVAC